MTAEHAIRFNQLAVEASGEPFQVRDRGLLESALDSPKNHWHHGEQRVPQLAAHLLLAVARNHPFAQGNKRVALLVADAFLTINRHRLVHPDNGFADLILDTLTRHVPEVEFIARFSSAVTPPVPIALRRTREIEREMRSGLFNRTPTDKA